jgi:hypothetical protein
MMNIKIQKYYGHRLCVSFTSSTFTQNTLLINEYLAKYARKFTYTFMQGHSYTVQPKLEIQMLNNSCIHIDR